MIEQKEKIIGLLNALFPNIKIILFGSQARGDYTEKSDIDLAIDIGRKITVLELAQVQNIIEALNIPQKVEVVDMHRIPNDIKKSILDEGIIWKS